MNDDLDEEPHGWRKYRIASRDMAPLALAAACTLLFLYLMFGPSPFATLLDHPKSAQTNEVSVSLPQKP